MRVTVDIDDKNRDWWAWSVYYMMIHSGEFNKVEIYKTRRGFHVVGYGSALTEKQANILRQVFGDDQNRLEIDECKHPLQPKQVLWNIKNGYEVKLLERWDNGS